MTSVTVYGTRLCPYCLKARRLLKKKGIRYTNVDVSSKAKRAEMAGRAKGRTSVPQIFIGDRHIGGCDDLVRLDKKGQLARMLRGG
ncbi:glutaredoxin 3 [Magnetospira sp. QH-2]|uniref:glutaredoxin 3 n=1 Tax=Magnetospira sp. (strain QH-2) TaxID=1288970 RepID=UPI0003E80C6C|nr:glutaredoxin 3 [Magnetospira sp. QH-2]CCQ72960.1 glutaredoxin 3 [Magnetospira sp. QH-2]